MTLTATSWAKLILQGWIFCFQCYPSWRMLVNAWAFYDVTVFQTFTPKRQNINWASTMRVHTLRRQRAKQMEAASEALRRTIAVNKPAIWDLMAERNVGLSQSWEKWKGAWTMWLADWKHTSGWELDSKGLKEPPQYKAFGLRWASFVLAWNEAHLLSVLQRHAHMLIRLLCISLHQSHSLDFLLNWKSSQ